MWLENKGRHQKELGGWKWYYKEKMNTKRKEQDMEKTRAYFAAC